MTPTPILVRRARTCLQGERSVTPPRRTTALPELRNSKKKAKREGGREEGRREGKGREDKGRERKGSDDTDSDTRAARAYVRSGEAQR